LLNKASLRVDDNFLEMFLKLVQNSREINSYFKRNYLQVTSIEAKTEYILLSKADKGLCEWNFMFEGLLSLFLDLCLFIQGIFIYKQSDV